MTQLVHQWTGQRVEEETGLDPILDCLGTRHCPGLQPAAYIVYILLIIFNLCKPFPQVFRENIKNQTVTFNNTKLQKRLPFKKKKKNLCGEPRASRKFTDISDFCTCTSLAWWHRKYVESIPQPPGCKTNALLSEVKLTPWTSLGRGFYREAAQINMFADDRFIFLFLEKKTAER